MTLSEFTKRALRAEQQRLRIPPGWWGTYQDVTNGTVRVRFTGSCWRISCAGMTISRHDSRDFAISKARKL